MSNQTSLPGARVPNQVSRRVFVAALSAGSTCVRPIAAMAQNDGKMRTIGVLGTSVPANWSAWTDALVRRLNQHGWIEGRTVAFEYRWAEGRGERYEEIAAEFVRLNVDVIVTVGGAVAAAKRATSTIPIVFAIGADPVGSGLVANLARPGGNVTGLSIQSTDLVGKRIELVRETVPGLRRFAIIGNVNYGASLLEIEEAKTVARQIGLSLDVLGIRSADDIALVFANLGTTAQALYVCADPLVNVYHARINKLAFDAKMPTIHPFRDYLGSGGLMSYGPYTVDLFRRAGDFVDKILRGTKPGELPVEQPTKFEFIVNLTTARMLGLTIPPSLLARADEVIE